MTDAFALDEIQSLDDVREFVARGYRAIGNDPVGSSRHPGEPIIGRLPLAVAEPGPLMERAVELAGDDGITLQQLHGLIDVGKERFERGLSFMRSSGRVTEARERRPNRAGRLQEQVVFRRAL